MKYTRRMRMVMFIAMVLAGLAFAGSVQKTVQAAPNGASLTGMVKSASGEKMGGVTVSAKAEGQTITTTVFTDELGDYYFPPMEPGKYRVWAQADTYETGRSEVELGSAKHQDFTLKPMKDFVQQLTGDQLLASLPEDTTDDRRMKQVFRNNCTGCHQPNYILQNRFDEEGWTAMLNLMERVNVNGIYSGPDKAPGMIIDYQKKELAAYLARMRGAGPSAMKLKVRPRPTGDAARVVITEYDVPTGRNGGHPSNDGSDWSLGTPSSLNGNNGVHDAQVDFNGNIWFTNSAASVDRSYGKIDTKTGKVTSFALPGRNGLAASSHGMTRDPQGNLWFNASGSADAEGAPGRLARLDPITEHVDLYTPPKGMSGVGGTLDIDGKGYVWATTNVGAIRFNPNSHEFTEFKSLTYKNADGVGNTYGLAADREGNGWWEEMSIDIVGKSDIETGKSLEVKLPPVAAQMDLVTPDERKLYAVSGSDWNSAVPWAEGPRRMGADKNGDVVWVCDWWGGNLARIDIHTLKTTIIPLPRQNSLQPYHAAVDKDHNVWINLMNADEVIKYDPKTSQWTEYSLPTLGTENRFVSLLERDGKMQVIVPYIRTSKVARMTFRTKEDIQALAKQIQQQARVQ